jgi:sulfite reductase (ferredoxin)
LKIPYGKITSDQLAGVADISDEFATGNLHLTTRQNIQLHYVKIDDSPKIWIRLAELGLTAREACGNTVRNITASPTAGIDPNEAFDVSSYVQSVFEYFLRNPICQEMGRKIKPAFSSTPADSAYTYFSDFGFIPRIINGERGFKLVIGGGLGALAIVAVEAFDFIPENQIIPFMEATIRVFDRYGERKSRQKARLKFLLKKLGTTKFLALVQEELDSLSHQFVTIEKKENRVELPPYFSPSITDLSNERTYQHWKSSNVFSQKQEKFRAVYLKVTLGDLSSDQARELARIVKRFAADDIRITINQNLLLRFVYPEHLPELYLALKNINLIEAGANGLRDITACPGTDTCNLGVTNSTSLTLALEKHIVTHYKELLDDLNLDIKISGCMNSCGQHMAASIGFHGSSIKHQGKIIPAMQVVVGGGLDHKGIGYIAQKVLKIPTKRVPQAVSLIIDDFLANTSNNSEFIHYAQEQGRRFYYDLLKPLADLQEVEEADFLDWGQDHLYQQAIGVGECAGVILDVVGTILQDAHNKLENAFVSFHNAAYKDAVYHAYSAYVTGAKAILLGEDIKCNTHISILQDFQNHFIETGKISQSRNFLEEVLRLKENLPNVDFVKSYLEDAKQFIQNITKYRNINLTEEKTVVESYYKA